MIQEILDDILKPKEIRQRSGKISPSKLGQCYRRSYWDRLNENPSNPIDERTLRVFKAGDIFHSFLQDNLLKTYPTWQKEVKVETEDVLGFADLVTDTEVIDIKSQHSRKFWRNTKDMQNGEDIKKMFWNNWLQVMWYTQQLGKERARLVFVSKDDLCIQEYSQPFDDFWARELETEFNTIRDYWDKKVLPPASPRLYWKEREQKFGECKYCQFATKCEIEVFCSTAENNKPI